MTEQKLVEKIAGIDFCWSTCGEIANTCVKQSTCAAFGDRQNKSYAHPILDYRKAKQIIVLVENAGYVRLAEDQTLPAIHETGDYEQDLQLLHHEYFANSWRKVIP